VLERQRAKKSASELAKLKIASEVVLASMQAVIANHGPGSTKNDIVDALRAEVKGHLRILLITAGTATTRALRQKWEKGDVMSIDSGGNYHGYIGDICRMAIQASPMPNSWISWPRSKASARRHEGDARRRHGTGNLRRRRAVAREIEEPQSPRFPGARMGMVSHEAPRLTSHGPVPYPCEYADMPLESGMVVSWKPR